MVIGVMSDTHGNRPLMHAVAAHLCGKLGAGLLFHLGDDYRDAVELAEAGYEMRMVPGLWCPEYHDFRIPRRIVEDIEGVSVACAHADRDLRAATFAAAVILTGHTHVPRIERVGFSLYVNPGHLKARSDRGAFPTFAGVDIGSDVVVARIYDMDWRVCDEKRVLRGELA
ncbi:MAG TPA: metallophosphoesterase family protein [Candidatus Hydrogenedentes bacterium]|nr:metallophosphoesterase family protein [Candidatus Hydrogenedentota bacterium]HOS02398.1 metallophosphoesterase family protein [Candidatus Hydrogenedentota bacterium]